MFSKSGELLGVMLNKDYCAIVTKLEAQHSIETGSKIRAQKTSHTLNYLGGRYRALPVQLY